VIADVIANFGTVTWSWQVVNMEQLAAGEKKVYCRCWLSDTFPLCNGAHAKHNTETGDNVGPLIVSAAK
jgi:CDGSH-type Zn-finger protein